MNPEEREKLTHIGRQFRIPGEFHDGHRIKIGHINETFAATYQEGPRQFRVVHQTINTHVFREPEALMNNVIRVTEHLRRKLAEQGATQLPRRALEVVFARSGLPFHIEPDGRFWRTFVFVDGVRSYDAVETPTQAHQAGHAFGRFQSLLADLPARELATTIPDFHHTPKRFERLLKAIGEDEFNRAKIARREIAFAQAMEPLVGTLIAAEARGEVPTRVTHNDTKINNVMLDDTTNRSVAVIDLDTVMPGLPLYDFGEMMRTSASSTAEDDPVAANMRLVLPYFRVLVEGYLESAVGGVLNATERAHLGFAGKLMTYENGLRFLTDYLQGDTYYKIKHPRHNLDRTRTQFALVRDIEANQGEMNRILDTVAKL